MHNFLKLSPFRADITVHKFDVIGLWETYLNFSTLHDNNNNLHLIPDYNLHREYHPLNIKQGVFTTTFLLHLIFKKTFITCRNTLNKKQNLKTSHVIALNYIAHLINLKMILSHLSITLN